MNYQLKEFEKEDINNFSDFVLGLDIGGTNTNFGIAGIQNKKIKLLFSINYKTHELPDLNKAFSEVINYSTNQHNIKIKSACIGAAGAVSPKGDYAKLTNTEININTQEIIKETSLESVFIINDFQSIGLGINLLDHGNENDILKIKKTNNENILNNTKAVIGAGTGLGKSILFYDKNLNAYIPTPSEGGHEDFPISNDHEMKLINFIKKYRNINQNITYEELLSGRGLENIYMFLKEKQQYIKTDFTNEIENTVDKAPLISKYKNNDETCRETFRLFTQFYARCAKNFALDTLPYNGLYIAGGIASKNKEIFKTEEFLKEFENAYRRKEILEKIPIYVIANYDVSLYGACFAAYYKNL